MICPACAAAGRELAKEAPDLAYAASQFEECTSVVRGAPSWCDSQRKLPREDER